MHGGQIRNRRLYCQRSRPVPKAVFRAGRGGQWVHYFVALVREPKGDHRGGGADGQGVWCSPYGWLMDRQYVKVYNYLKYNDMKIQVELNLEDVFEEAVYNEATLKEEFTSSVRLAVVRELKEKFKDEGNI